jgi:hypothetical protein
MIEKSQDPLSLYLSPLAPASTTHSDNQTLAHTISAETLANGTKVAFSHGQRPNFGTQRFSQSQREAKPGTQCRISPHTASYRPRSHLSTMPRLDKSFESHS